MSIKFETKPRGSKKWHILNDNDFPPVQIFRHMIDVDGSALIITESIGDGAYIRLSLTSDAFRDLAQRMLDVDSDTAYKAFGAALCLGPRRPVYDEDGRELG